LRIRLRAAVISSQCFCDNAKVPHLIKDATSILKQPYFNLLSLAQRFLRFTEVFEDEGDFTGSEELGLGRHATGLEGGIEFTIATDPGVQVTEGSRGGGSIWEI
jgi:hypothetical protein